MNGLLKITLFGLLGMLSGLTIAWNFNLLLTNTSIPLGIRSVGKVELSASVKNALIVVKENAKEETIENKETLTLIFGGDVMLDRNVRKLGEQSGYDKFFEDLKPLFEKSDYSIINLEGPITSNDSKTLLPNGQTTTSFIFTFATSTAEVLAKNGVDIVSLANNHSDNFGLAGLGETKTWLEKVGVRWFGDPLNRNLGREYGSDENSLSLILEKNNIRVALVGYHAFQNGLENVLDEISRLASTGYFVIVMPHWGEEYKPVANIYTRERAKKIVEAGARLIIGAHPHVIQDHEEIMNTPVFYSLGNLVFDQYFSPDVMKGMLLEITLQKDRDAVYIEDINVHYISLESKFPKLVETISNIDI